MERTIDPNDDEANDTVCDEGIRVVRKGHSQGRISGRIEALVPWAEFCALIELHHPKAGGGRRPGGPERMLRMYLIANWFNLGDGTCENALYNVAAICEFWRIDPGRERMPGTSSVTEMQWNTPISLSGSAS